MSVTHLNIHSGYSLMNSTISIDKLVERAHELEFSSLALTDDDVLYGVVPFYKACLAKQIKPIIGMTTKVVVNDQLLDVILLAKTNEGYRHLLQISTMNQTKTDKLTISELDKLGKGVILIVKTSSEFINTCLKESEHTYIYSIYEQFTTIFQKGNIYFSIENYEVNAELKTFSQTYRDINVVAINEVRYLHDKDVYSYDCLQAMRRGETWEVTNPTQSIKSKYLSSKTELEDKFAFWPEALQTTADIANKCHVTIDMSTPRLPAYPLEESQLAHDVLRDVCFKNLQQIYEHVTDEIEQRLTYELKVIKSLGFSDYFLIVADFVQYAKSNNILVGPGRGSAAGSIVSYVLGITMVDPIKYNLLFERFLNPERTSLPDIDIDFSDVQRDKVIQYIKEKYGSEHVAQIITFGTFGARSLLRELMKTLNVHDRDQAYLLKHIPVQSTKTIIEHVKDQKSLKTYVKNSRKLRLLLLVAKNLEGLPRHTSTHAAGIVITKERLVNYTPLTAGQDDLSLTQFSMNELESVGLLKIDLLGLRNLSLIERIIGMIRRVEKRDIDLTQLPVNDEKTFRLLQTGKTNGVFQLESDGMKRVLKQLQPTSFEDIVALNALYRPGPMEQIPTYMARKHGREQFTYLHPHLKPILEETYGVLIYQEQIMQIAHKLAGFSLGEADLLRRAMSKKEPELMAKQKEAFINGCVRHGYNKQVAEQLFSWIEQFANYGFNKSHSVAYSKISYQLSYLKAHFPHIFFAQLLSTTSSEVKLTDYVKEARQLNIPILPPSINNSFGQYSVEADKIRIGLLAIKGINYETIQEIIRVRRKGRFTDLFDFCIRVSQSIINRQTIETLILSGTFDELYDNRASLLASLDEALERAELFGTNNGQATLFMNQLEMRAPEYVSIDDFPQLQKLVEEKELIGIHVSDHPLKTERHLLKSNNYTTIERAKLMNNNQAIHVVSFIQEVKKVRTKRGESMAFITMTDETDEIEVVVFPNVFRQVNQWVEENLLVEGQYAVSERDGRKQLIANHLTLFKRDNLQQSKRLFLRFLNVMTEKEKEQLHQLVQQYPGKTTIIVYYEQQKQTYQLGSHYLIDANDDVLTLLKQMFGEQNVVLK